MRYTSVLLASVACGIFAVPALAQQAPVATQDAGVDDIIVTAQKREQNLQDVPVAVTAVTGAALEAKGITQFEDLTRVSPGLTITRATTTPASSINLRGIGTFAFSIGVEPSVAVVVDDLAVLQQAQAFSNLSDVERIEVLRGPQGTLFGKGASAGVVNLVTRAPSSEMQGSLTVSATTDQQYRLEGTVSGPLSEAVGFRLSGFYGHSEGYIRNLTNGTDLGRDRSWGLRGRLKIQATDSLTFDLMASHAETRTNGTPRTFFNVPTGAAVFGAPLTPNLVGITPGFGNNQIRINTDPDNTNLTTSASLRATLDLGLVNLVSITGYQDWKYNFLEDVDGTASSAFGNAGGLIQSGPFKSNVFSQELRLVSNGKGPLQYLIGLYYADGSTTRSFARGPSGPLLSGWDARNGSKTYAAFVQATYDITPTTHIDGGLRFNREEIAVSFLNTLPPPTTLPANNATCLAVCNGNTSDNQVTYKVALRQDLADRVMAYVSYATGYKGQGYDISSGFSPTRAVSPVLAEHSKAYEIGLKSRFLDSRLQLNLTAFLTDYNNFQAQSAVVLPSGAVQFTLNNVGQLRTKGVEMELSARPIPALRLEASAAYTDATIVSFPAANCYTGQTAAQGCVGGFQNLAGFPLANAPKFKFTLGASYDVALPGLPFDGFITADYRHQSGVNYDLSQNPVTVQPTYGLFNASLGFKSRDSDRYRVTFFVNNLFDQAYTGSLGLGTGASTDLIVQYLPRDYQRTFGLRVNTQF